MSGSGRVALTLEQCWHRVPGGTAVAALGMARALKARTDWEPVGVAARHRMPPSGPFRPDIPVAQLGLPRRALYESWHYLGRPAIESATGPVDVVHATAWPMPAAGAPVVLTVHDLAFLHRPQHFTRHGVRFFRRGLKLALSKAALVLCPSDATRADLLAAGFEAERLRTVPLGIDPTQANSDEIELVRARLGLPDRYVLWTGTIEPRKNLGGLIEAFGRLGGAVSLVLAGPEGWNEDIAAVIKPIRERVITLGFLSGSELRALYAGATVFCFPSLLEGFGFPVLEAMAQGTPVVTSRGTSTEELAGDAGILVDPLDPDSIAGGLSAVLNDDATARRLALAGLERASQYSWERTADALVSAYEEAAQ